MKTLAILGIVTLFSAKTLYAEELDLTTSSQYVPEAISLSELVSQIQIETQSVIDAFSAKNFDLVEPSLQSLNEHLLILNSIPKDYLTADPLLQEDLLSCCAALWATFRTLTPSYPEAQPLHTTLDLFTECHTYSRPTELTQEPDLDEDVIEIIQSSVDPVELPYFDLICVKRAITRNKKETSYQVSEPQRAHGKSSSQKPKQESYHIMECASSQKARHHNPQILLIGNKKSEKSGEASATVGIKATLGGKDSGKVSPYAKVEVEDRHGNYAKGEISRNNDGSYDCAAEAGKKKKSDRGRSDEE